MQTYESDRIDTLDQTVRRLEAELQAERSKGAFPRRGERCEECSVNIENVFDHANYCKTGKEDFKLWHYDDLYMCYRELVDSTGPCPLHDSPDLPNALSVIDTWKKLINDAKTIMQQVEDGGTLDSNWSEDCEQWLREVKEVYHAA